MSGGHIWEEGGCDDDIYHIIQGGGGGGGESIGLNLPRLTTWGLGARHDANMAS